MRRLVLFVLLCTSLAVAQAQNSNGVAPFVTVSAPVFVVNHVRIIDGTGATPREDQTIVIANGKIQSIGPAATAQAPAGAQQFDRAGYTIIPGLVGMHNHLYYTDSISVQRGSDGKIGEPGLYIAEIPYTSPRVSPPCALPAAWNHIPISRSSSALIPTRCRARKLMRPRPTLKARPRYSRRCMNSPALMTRNAWWITGPPRG